MDKDTIVINSDEALETIIISLNPMQVLKDEKILQNNENIEANYGNASGDSTDNIEEKDINFFEHLSQYRSEIGDMGEQYVLNTEKEKLKNTIYINKIKHISKIDNSAGYDILSYETDGTEIYIEVKTTDKKYDTFYITQNELAKANLLKSIGKRYLIYRVYNILTSPTYTVIADITKEFELEPIVWKVSKID